MQQQQRLAARGNDVRRIVLSSSSFCIWDNRSLPVFGRPLLLCSHIYRAKSLFFLLGWLVCFDLSSGSPTIFGRKGYLFQLLVEVLKCLFFFLASQCKQARFYRGLEKAKEYVPEPVLHYIIKKVTAVFPFFPEGTNEIQFDVGIKGFHRSHLQCVYGLEFEMNRLQSYSV